MILTYPTDLETEAVDAMRVAIGRDITFNYLDHTDECTLCDENPMDHTSTNPYCTGCGGTHFIAIIERYSTLAHITWGPADKMAWETGGQIFNGDCRVQIKYTQPNLDIVDKTLTVEVDGQLLEIRKTILRGVQILNRIILDLIQIEKD